MTDILKAAQQADDAFSVACQNAGYTSRWDWNQHIDPGTEELREAYRAKVRADNEVSAAFNRLRNIHW